MVQSAAIMRRINKLVPFLSVALAACLLAPGCGKGEDKKPEESKPEATKPEKPETQKPEKSAVTLPDAPALPELPKGLPETPEPEDNKATPEKVMLGELLFFDTRMSDGGEFSCENCHYADKGWTDALPLSPKHDGKVNSRHSPTLVNVAYYQDWYWDGRKATLEDQILAAWIGQVGATPDKIAEKLAAIPAYAAHFQRAFDEGPTKDNIPKALAAFVRIKLRSGNSPWDRYQAGEKDAVSEDVVAGFEVFSKKTLCAACHPPPLFTDTSYHNVGVGYEGNDKPDPGRFNVSKDDADTGKFKTPGLRSVAASAPYFHDGSVATLEEAVDFMLAGGHQKGNDHIDPLIKGKKTKLNKKERAQLIAFIKALTPDQSYTKPTLP